MNCDRLIIAITLGEIIALQHARYGVLRRQLDHACCAQFVKPAGVKTDLRLGRIQNAEHLLLIGLGVLFHLLTRQRRSGRIFTGRVTDHAGEVANQEHHLMPQILEVTQLVNQHRVAQMQIRCRRVKARLHAQRLPLLQLFDQLGFNQQFVRPTLDQCQRVLNVLFQNTTSNTECRANQQGSSFVRLQF